MQGSKSFFVILSGSPLGLYGPGDKGLSSDLLPMALVELRLSVGGAGVVDMVAVVVARQRRLLVAMGGSAPFCWCLGLLTAAMM